MSKFENIENTIEYLESMVGWIEAIERELASIDSTLAPCNGHEFYKNFKHVNVYDDILRFFMYMCDDAREIPTTVQLEHTDIPWTEMRTRLEYPNFDVDVMWHIVTKELPENKRNIKILIQKLTNESNGEQS